MAQRKTTETPISNIESESKQSKTYADFQSLRKSVDVIATVVQTLHQDMAGMSIVLQTVEEMLIMSGIRGCPTCQQRSDDQDVMDDPGLPAMSRVSYNSDEEDGRGYPILSEETLCSRKEEEILGHPGPKALILGRRRGGEL